MSGGMSLAGAALGLGFVLAPVLGVFAPLGMAPLLVVAGLLSMAAIWRGTVTVAWRQPLLVALAALCLWALVSALWAVNPPQAMLGSGKLALNALLGLALVFAARACPSQARTLMMLGTALGGLVLVVEYASGLSLSMGLAHLRHQDVYIGKSVFNRGVSVLAVLAWPAIALAWRRHGGRGGAAAMALVGAAMALSDNTTATLAFVAGLLAAGAAMLRPAWAARALALGMVTLVLAAPLLVRTLPTPQHTFEHWRFLPTSMHHRLTIWTFAAERVVERPLAGWGFDAARDIPGGEDRVAVSRPGRLDDVPEQLSEQVMPLHPHNAALHVWMELGAIGAALFCAVLWLLPGMCLRLPDDRTSRPAALATLAAAFVVANMSFGLWQSWWQATLWLAAAGCAALWTKTEDTP